MERAPHGKGWHCSWEGLWQVVGEALLILTRSIFENILVCEWNSYGESIS